MAPAPSAKRSAVSTKSRANELEDELNKWDVRDENGYLPIHRAAFSGHEATIRNILDDVIKRNELETQLEARTEPGELTPLLLATAVGRLEIIACLQKYPVNLNAVDVNGHGIAAIAALSQNERTLRYIIDLPFPKNSYNVWKPLFKLFKSADDDESVICGRALELLTRHEPNNHRASQYWAPMVDNGLISTLIYVFTESTNEDVLISAYLLLLNGATEYPRVKTEMTTIKNAFAPMLKHTKSSNEKIVILLGRVLAVLSEYKPLAERMVEQGLIESILTLIQNQRSPQIISSYFDCLANIVSFSPEFQQKVASSQSFITLLIEHYVNDFDPRLCLSVMRFIRRLVLKNESIQNLMAQNGACPHILSGLSAFSKELQQTAIEAVQAMSEGNPHVQRIMLEEKALENLLNLLEKTNFSALQTASVCTLWVLCGTSSARKREVATRIGVKRLISFYSIKAEEHLFAVTDALGELAKRTASFKMNIQEEISREQGIPHLIRLFRSDNEALVLSAMKTVQLLACAPGFVSNRKNQETIIKNEGAVLLVTLLMHAKSEIIRVEAAQALACIALSNPQCATIIENTLDFSYEQILRLMESENPSVRLAAGNALASFAYNNARVQSKLAKLHKFPFEYFQKFMENPNEQIRCTAAFQLVVLAGLVIERTQSENTAIGCGSLIDILKGSRTDEGKAAAAECLARLAHMKSGVPQALVSADVVKHLCNLYSSSNDTTIGIASVALGYLSNVPEAQRQLLKRSLKEPDIMAFLKVYNCLPDMPPRMSKHLLEDWNRQNNATLPELRSRYKPDRYFKVLANSIERLRPSSFSNQMSEAAPKIVKFYLPPIRQKA